MKALKSIYKQLELWSEENELFVVQVSDLISPLLFLLYMDGVWVKELKGIIIMIQHLFADDTFSCNRFK